MEKNLSEIKPPKKLTSVQGGPGVQGLVWYLADETGANRCITDEVTAKAIARAFEFVQKFLDNFEECDECVGGGKSWDELDEMCETCRGEGMRIVSQGVLYNELRYEAVEILAGKS